MEVQSQTKHRITFTKQDVIAILQAHIEEQGYIDNSYEVCSDNIPDQIVVDMMNEIGVTIDTHKDVKPQTTQFKSNNVKPTEASLTDGEPLSKLSQSTHSDGIAETTCSQDMAVESLHSTSIVNAYGSIPQNHSITKTYPKGWDPFAD